MTFLIRWCSYPFVFGSAAIAILTWVGAGSPVWPAVPLIALAGIFSVGLLERVQPYQADWLRDHDDTWTDAQHSVVNLTILFLSAQFLSFLVMQVPILSIWPGEWPLWAQVVLAMLPIDLGLYWMHRLSHVNQWLWRLHEPHHSSERLYWLNGEKRHPLHAVIMAGPGLLVDVLLGAPSVVVGATLAILSVHLAFQHANLDYSLGPLRHLFGVAESHRWHHKREYEDAQVNFGEWLMLWDHLFGTYRAPPGLLAPGEVGLKDQGYPTGYWAQLKTPFTR